MSDDVDRIVGEGGEADEVLRQVVAALGERYAWSGIAFVEGGELVLGPSTGAPPPETVSVPIVYDGKPVGELRVADGDVDRAHLEGVAQRIAPYCLVGWDTGGEAWSP